MPETQLRKLAAILAADIAGYSALMGSDEERTVRDLKAHQASVLPMIGDFGGRLIDTAGDGILAEFGSAVKAVECAVAIQNKMTERNAQVEPERRMRFRIGINIGDVIYDEARIYGDGLNIAARLESIAEPGGIFISRQAYDQVDGKLALSFRKLGPQTLKNILKQVEVFAVDASLAGANAESRSPPVAKAAFATQATPRSAARWPLAAAMVVVLSLVAGGGYLYLRSLEPLRSVAPAATAPATPPTAAAVVPAAPAPGAPPTVIVAPSGEAAPDPRRFDGLWTVDIACPNSQGAMGYGFRFAAQVKEGYFSGTRGTEGQPGWLVVEGKIRPDGGASLFAQGLTGDPGSSIGNVSRGTSYAYHVDARFEGASASGKRVEVRPCDFTAVRQ